MTVVDRRERVSTCSLQAVVDATRPSALATAGGLKLTERLLFVLQRSGVQRVYLVCAAGRRSSFLGLRAPQGLELQVIHSNLPPLQRGSGTILVLAAELVISPPALDRFVSQAAGARAVQAVADGATLPLLLCPPELLEGALAVCRHKNGQQLLEGAHTREIGGEGTIALVADTRERLARAEKALLAALGRSDDGLFTRLVDRRISRAVTRRLAATRITPSAVTLLSVAAGILAGLVLSVGGYLSGLAGCSLFLASTILDGCDGELARLKFQESRFGALLDIVGDNVVHLAVFGGLGIGLFRQHPGLPLRVAAFLLLFGLLVAMATTYWCIFRNEPAPAQRKLFNAFASREFVYLMLILAVAGRLHWFFWLATAGTFVFTALLLFLGRKRRGDQGEPSSQART